MTEWVSLFTAFSLGLLSSAHCVGMCGGIMGALTLAIPANAPRRRWQLLFSYNLGRIVSYCLMGLLLGFFAEGISQLGAAYWLRLMAGLLLIAMGLYLADWWRGLVYLERMGRYLWAYLQPLSKGLMPVSTARKALMLGVIWGWLPCGLVYSALAYALSQAQPVAAAAVMLAFGLGTLPAVLASGFVVQQLTRLLQARHTRVGFAVLIILFGLWTLQGAHHNHAGHENHQPSPSDPTPTAEELHHHH